VENNTIQASMQSFPAPAGTTAFVPAGTVHAIGAGVLLAEIQQNSDVTYRIYDWDRVDAQGARRELHLNKAIQVTRFGARHPGASTPLSHRDADMDVTVLGACRYFASELLTVRGAHTRSTQGRSFHIIMAREGRMVVSSGEETCALEVCRPVLVPAGAATYSITGSGKVLNYYVPDLVRDIIGPLRAAGHGEREISFLGVERGVLD
jgi:mannose-6-phosphate isomerase